MRWQWGALFLIKFLSKLAILGTLSIEGRSTSYPVPASLRPLFAARRLRTSIYAGAFSSRTPETRGCSLTGAGPCPRISLNRFLTADKCVLTWARYHKDIAPIAEPARGRSFHVPPDTSDPSFVLV